MGVDCGFAAPGIAIVSACADGTLEFIDGECIETERSAERESVATDDFRRISFIGNWLREASDTYRPDVVVLELPMSGARGAMAIKGMAYATAISVTVVQSYFKCKTLQLISPYDSKRWCTLKVKAEKEEMIRAVSSIFPDITWPNLKKKKAIDVRKSEAIADSLAAILTFLRIKPLTISSQSVNP